MVALQEATQLLSKMSRADKAQLLSRVANDLASDVISESVKTTEEPIRKTAGVVGGDACIRNTRIPVWTLVQYKKMGRSEADLVADFQGLTFADLDAAWDYYRRNTAEIEEAIAAEEREG